MGALISLLFGFTGRINRAKWWLGLVILGIANIAGGLLINPDFFVADEPPPPSLADTLWQIALLVPMMAITVKRFNDTDRPAWLGYLFAPLGAVLYLGPHLKDWVGPIGATVTLWPVLLLLFVYFVFAFIDNGFVHGTDGPNRYGPDPLARGASPA
jgi:uncharacterized membrane protein YhaH (DUF805 family)